MLIFMSCQENKFDFETTLNLVTSGANNLTVLALYYVQFPQFSSPAQTTKYPRTVYPIPVAQCYFVLPHLSLVYPRPLMPKPKSL